MLFRDLAKYFEELEKTSSRLALIDILCDLFGEVKTEEIGKVSYLIQGRVAPFYEPVEIGMAEKSVAKALAKAYVEDLGKVDKQYSLLGDLGKVALKLGEDKKSNGLDVSEVFE